MIPLIIAELGVEQTVQLVKGNDKTRAHIQKIGIAPGAKLTVVSMQNGDVIVTVKDVRIALTRDIASRIMV